MKYILYIFVDEFGRIETRMKPVPLEDNNIQNSQLLEKFPVGNKMQQDLRIMGFYFSNWHVVRKELNPVI